MGICGSSELGADELARELLVLLQRRQKEQFDALLSEILWHNTRQPDWEYAKSIVATQLETSSTTDTRETILHYVVRTNDVEYLRVLANYELPLTAVNSHGNNVIHTATISGCSRAVFEVLLKDAALPNVLHIANEDGDYPLHLATRNHFGWLVDMMLERGVNPALRNNEGDTALDLLRNTHHRNPLSRGNITARKRIAKDWWEVESMDLAKIMEALQEGAPRQLRSVAPQHDATSEDELLAVAPSHSSGMFR